MDNILTDNIHIININENISLFFHKDSLQIYPLEKDGLICKFLQEIEYNGIEKTKNIYGEEDFNTLFTFVSNQINIAPKTIEIQKSDGEEVIFENIIIPISGNCNLNCPYCFAQTDSGFHFNDCTEENIDCIADFLVTSASKAHRSINIVFFGGEPLLKFDIIQYTIKLFNEKYPKQKVNYSITTNGTILNKNILHFFKKNKVTVLLSLDGPDNEFNLRKFRNGEKSIDVVLKNIKILKRHNLPIELRATMINTNPYIVETFDFFENLGIPFNITFAYQSENKSHTEYVTHDEQNLKLIEAQFNELFNYYTKRMDNHQSISTKIFSDISKIIDCRIKNTISCSAGRNFFTIIANGDIFSCSHFMNNPKYKIGNIFTNNIDCKNLIPISVDEIDDCKTCWAKYLCSGGCVAQKISMGKRNNTSKIESECVLEKVEWELYIKLYYYAKQKKQIAPKTND